MTLGDNTAEAPSRIFMPTGLPWFDAVLGGGFVSGGVYLLEGGIGAGKGMLMAQAVRGFCNGHLQNFMWKFRRVSCADGEAGGVLYVSGSEDVDVLAGRIDFDVKKEGAVPFLNLLSTEDVNDVVADIRLTKPPLIVIDDLQSIGEPRYKSALGSEVQVLWELCEYEAKKVGSAIVFVSHRPRSVLNDDNVDNSLLHRADVTLLLARSVPDYGDGTHIFGTGSGKNRFGAVRTLRLQTNSEGWFEAA